MTITELARQAVEHYVRTSKPMPVPSDLPPELTRPAAAFVSLHQAGGDLRGCIGTTSPTTPSLAAEVIANAVAAAVDDPRFEPVTADELPGLHLGVDVLSSSEPVADQSKLDPRIDGVIVTARDGRRGVLLPDLPDVTTVEQQIAIARDKAGIGSEEPITVAKFTVKRFEE